MLYSYFERSEQLNKKLASLLGVMLMYKVCVVTADNDS